MKTFKTFAIIFLAFVIVSFEATEQMAQKILNPSETLKTFSVAAKNLDIKTAKKLMTKASLEQQIDYAKSQKITVDKLFRRSDG